MIAQTRPTIPRTWMARTLRAGSFRECRFTGGGAVFIRGSFLRLRVGIGFAFGVRKTNANAERRPNRYPRSSFQHFEPRCHLLHNLYAAAAWAIRQSDAKAVFTLYFVTRH